MTLGKIDYQNTYGTDEDGNRVFTGMYIAADFLDKGKSGNVSFIYRYWTNNLRGQVERVLSRYFAKKSYPADITDVDVE